MDIQALRTLCNEGDQVYLHLPPPKHPRRSVPASRLLCGSYGPRGYVTSSDATGEAVYFSSLAVLRFLDKLDLIDDTVGVKAVRVDSKMASRGVVQ